MRRRALLHTITAGILEYVFGTIEPGDYNLMPESRGLTDDETEKLSTVEWGLRRVVLGAKEVCLTDFVVFEGARTQDRQAQYYASGVSQTMNSLHLRHEGAPARAVDLVPVIGGEKRWEIQPCGDIALAMKEAAEGFRIADRIRWGGAWITLDVLGEDPLDDVDEYLRAEIDGGKRGFVDGVHFEIILPF